MKKILSIFKDLKTKDAVITLIIVALPFLFYIYRLAPDAAIWETSWFRIDAGDFGGVYFLLWLINKKSLLILFLIIWFITCKHWWRYVILVPLIIELFKLHSLYDSLISIDEIEFLQSLPFTIPVILFLILLSKRLGFYTHYSYLKNELNQEIDDLLDELNILGKREIITLKEEFENLKNEKSLLSLKEYNDKLLKLRKRIVEKI